MWNIFKRKKEFDDSEDYYLNKSTELLKIQFSENLLTESELKLADNLYIIICKVKLMSEKEFEKDTKSWEQLIEIEDEILKISLTRLNDYFLMKSFLNSDSWLSSDINIKRSIEDDIIYGTKETLSMTSEDVKQYVLKLIIQLKNQALKRSIRW